MAEALAYAHEQGIVHRDVKPANMMLDTHDRVHLMDFGLASRQDEEAKLTNEGAVMGTPAYMSPEQAKGQQGEAQPATDQYAAGVVLYELLTGRTPFGGPPAVVLANVIAMEPDPPRKHRTYIPRDLETICLKAMAKTPGGRYANCQALADDLRWWQEGEPITARRLSLAERAVRWVKKEPKLSAATAMIALVLLISVVLVSSAARRADAARQRAERDAADARASQKQAEDARAETAEARAQKARYAGEALGALGTATEEREKAKTFQTLATAERTKANDFETHLVNERTKVSALQEMVSQERKRSEAFGPGSALADRSAIQIAFASCQSGDTEVAKSFLLIVPPERRGWEWRHVQKLCTAPDDTTHHTVKFSQATPKLAPKAGADGAPPKPYDAASFSPDASHVATFGAECRVWNTKTGAEVRALKGDPSLRGVGFSPDGARLVKSSLVATAQVWDVKTGSEVLRFGQRQDPPFQQSLLFSAAYSPDGTQIATAERLSRGVVRVWDARTGAELRALETHPDWVLSVAYSRDGAQIVSAEADEFACVWDAKTGAKLHALKSPPLDPAATTSAGRKTVASFSRDGARIVTCCTDGTTRIWDAKSGTEQRMFKHKGFVRSAGFSPDGTRVVTVTSDNILQFWDAAVGIELLAIRYKSRILGSVWSPDGTQLLIVTPEGIDVRDGGPSPPTPKP